MYELHDVIDGIDITYMYRKARLDCKHAVIIFSGFSVKGYDFIGGTLDFLQSHIIWIKDSFLNNRCCYLCNEMDFSIENSVIKFINKFLNRLLIDQDHVTLLGASKGGFSSLYFGLKYNFKNIIASAPQSKIGSFLYKVHLKEFKFMTRDENDRIKLDNLIYNISKKSNINKNIYLFSSNVDQYDTCDDLHNTLKIFNNFNHIVTDSCLCSEHNMITSYNIPMILSILYANSQNAYPRFGEYVYNGVNVEILNYDKLNNVEKNSLVSELWRCSFKNNKFYPEGVAFIKGVPSPTYGLFRKKIIFKSKHFEKIYTVGSTEQKICNRKYFEDIFVDYTTSGFASIHNDGIFLDLKNGKYDIYMEVKNDNYCISDRLIYNGGSVLEVINNKLYIIYNDNNYASLLVMNPISLYKPDECIVYNKWYKNNMIHYDGIMLKYGFEAKNYKDINFYIIFKNDNYMYTFKYAKSNIDDLNSKFDGYGNYSKCVFSSYKKQGLDISNVIVGEYDVYISMIKGGCIISKKIDTIVIGE